MNRIYGFEGEVKHKYDETVMNLFTEAFCTLPFPLSLKRRSSSCMGGSSLQMGSSWTIFERLTASGNLPRQAS